ncbi:MAG: glycoside hydrolase family 2 TIM barrel-domain containing protein [Clostridia bacterium]|nr:glycoside hydrolase family 2 TIM barrel-domain containing protein [Clostridia bacterium]
MKRIDCNTGWTVQCTTRNTPAVPVTLPHDAMLTEPRTAESRGEGNIGWFLGGDYTYRKTLSVPEQWKDQTVLLECEGVYQNAEVFLNGEKLAARPYGYTNFYVPLSTHLRCGADNELTVVAHNDDHPNSRWYSGSGMYRPAWLWIGEKAHIPVNGVRVCTVSLDPVIVEINVETSEPGTVRVAVMDADRTVLTHEAKTSGNRISVQLPVPNAKLWSVEHPHLYTLRATFGNDTVDTPFGIRLLRWDATNGLTLNGQRVILRGACVHHDNGILGACAFPEAEERKVRILKENGYNALRSAHNPCSKALLDACDRLGMLVMDEYVDVWYIHKTEHDYATHLADWWRRDLKDLVDKDFNHPSVVLYSTGNEVSETAQPRGIRLAGQFTSYLHELDETRPVTCGVNIFFNFLSSIGLGVYTDDKAKKEAEAAAAAPKEKPEKKKPVGSEFYNMLSLLIGDWFMKAGATLPPCDWKTRDAFAAMDIAGYNYGNFRYKHDLRAYPNRLILGSETLCKDAYGFWEIAKDNPRLIGDFVWPGWDYIGEVNTGAPEFDDYNTDDDPTTRLTGSCGRIDLTGKPRAEAAYTRVALEQAQGPFLAAIPVYEEKTPRINGWGLTKALESWSYRGSEGKEAAVEVYARAHTVALELNGRRVAKKRVPRNDCRTLFRIPYESGVLTAISYDRSGREIGRCTLRSAGEQTELKLRPETDTVQSGKLAFVRLQYEDPDGIWKPTERHMLHVAVTGGTLVGLGSAAPYKKGAFGGDTTETYFGEALAVIRPDGTMPLTLTVSDESRTVTAVIPVQA